jgi:hypothetical protein
MGSVAEKLLRSAQVPLITIRPAAALRHADQKVPSFPQRSITLTMSVSEVELARSALLHFINSNRSGRNLVQAFDLLTRLQSAVSPAVTDAAAVAEAPAPKR